MIGFKSLVIKDKLFIFFEGLVFFRVGKVIFFLFFGLVKEISKRKCEYSWKYYSVINRYMIVKLNYLKIDF